MRIELKDIRKLYGDTVVLDGVDLDEKVEALAVIGPSGGGKSTLLRIIGGLTTPTSGTLSLDGETVPTRERDLPPYRAQIGYVFQSGGLFEHLDARENIALPLRAVHGHSPEQAQERAFELLQRFGLVSEAHKKPSELSGGQQQRVAIARAIAPDPKILLLDEPTSALDPEFTNEVLDVIRSLRKEGTRFIVVTHEMGFARHACTDS